MRSISAFITLKIAVLAPIPSARVRMAMQVMNGFFRSWRKANLRSFITPAFRVSWTLWSIEFRGLDRNDGRKCVFHGRSQSPSLGAMSFCYLLDCFRRLRSRRAMAKQDRNVVGHGLFRVRR